jgi:hypothetical protein
MAGAFVDLLNPFRQLDILGESVRHVLLLPLLVALISNVWKLNLQFSPRKS